MRIHDAAHLSACVDDYADGFAVGQETVAPKSVFQVETLPALGILSAGFDLQASFK